MDKPKPYKICDKEEEQWSKAYDTGYNKGLADMEAFLPNVEEIAGLILDVQEEIEEEGETTIHLLQSHRTRLAGVMADRIGKEESS